MVRPGRGRGLIDLLQKIHAVDRVNRLCHPRRFFGLIRLEVADQMPAQPRIGRLRNFLQGLLHFVFAEIHLACFSSGADGIDRMSFGNGDQANVGGTSARATGRVRDPLANACQSLRNFLNTSVLDLDWAIPKHLKTHFFSCAIMPFACVAY